MEREEKERGQGNGRKGQEKERESKVAFYETGRNANHPSSPYISWLEH